jgi:hypothetical protein
MWITKYWDSVTGTDVLAVGVIERVIHGDVLGIDGLASRH